jgi:5-methylcytosine-specific restriction endonuclease McrA
MVRKRDRGHCASCGLDTYALKRSIKGKGSHRKLRELGFKPRKSLWELDHVVPLIDGGTHEAANLQTLCTPCHKRKTATEASRRGNRRRSEAARRTEDEVLAAVDAALAKSRRLLDQMSAIPARDGAPR